MAALTHPVESDLDLDLDLLGRLAQEDVPAFEAMRARLIAEFIDGSPLAYQRRLRGVQFRVDQVRRLAKTPLAATIRLSELMWESFLALNHELTTPCRARETPAAAATVLPFRRAGGAPT